MTKPSMKQAILSKCHSCMCEYADKHQDCGIVKCSLYSWMPYRKLEPDLNWTKYNPLRTGLVERVRKTLSPEEKKAIRERFTRAAK